MNTSSSAILSGYGDLVHQLEVETSYYATLEQLLKDKQSAIIQGDVETLQNLVHEEQRLIPKIRTATQSRALRASAIGALLKLRSETPSLKELIDLSPSHHVQKLLAFREQLIRSLDQIAHANRENEFLLNSSVELVRGLVQVLLGTEKNEQLQYGGHGKLQDTQTRRAHVDCQI